MPPRRDGSFAESDRPCNVCLMPATEDPALDLLPELAALDDGPDEAPIEEEEAPRRFDVRTWFESYLAEAHDSPEHAGLPFH